MYWPFYILVSLYCSLIFWYSSQSDPPAPEQLFPQFDKLEHVAAFGLLCALVLLGMKLSGRPHSLRKLLWIPVLFTVAFGFTDEFHQHFVPKRNVDPFDIVANTTGACLAQFILLRFYYRHSVAGLREAFFGSSSRAPAHAD